ncbi:MAG: cytochrome c oxidase subunit 3, partial [Bryobacteraceae bacterium]|nr:cytochrome c oxidase subunit 3 [Bryobacteraceae bacterium]
AYEFTTFAHEGFTPRANVAGSAFFLLTGFHGAHVSVGVIWLLTLSVLAWRGRIGPQDALKVEVAGLYWHFVDIVWIFLFPLLYLIGHRGAH